MRITDTLFAYPWQGSGNNCNTYLIHSDFPILIDPGHIRNELGQNCLDILRQALAADGFQLSNIKLILLTHGHPDHCEAAGLLKEESGAYIAIHRNDDKYLRNVAHRLHKNNADVAVPVADFYLDTGKLLVGKFYQANIDVIHTPGHSPGSICFYLQNEQTMITGDTVFAQSVGRTDLPGGSNKELAQSIAKLASYQIELLLPGHMHAIQGALQVKQNFTFIKRAFFD